MNVPRLSGLYLLSCMLDGARMDPRAFFTHQLQLCSVAASTKGRIVVGGFVTTIAHLLMLYLMIMIEYLGLSVLIKSLLSSLVFVRLRLVGCVGYALGVSLCLFLT